MFCEVYTGLGDFPKLYFTCTATKFHYSKKASSLDVNDNQANPPKTT